MGPHIICRLLKTSFSCPRTHSPGAPPTPVPPSESPPNLDINAIIQAVVRATLVANAASIAENPPAPSPVPTPTQPTGGHQPSASNNFFLNIWNGDLDSFPIFQAPIRAWFERLSFAGVTDFTTALPGAKNQSSLLRLRLRLRLMSGLPPDKVLTIFLHNPNYKCRGFRMCGRILDKYNP